MGGSSGGVQRHSKGGAAPHHCVHSREGMRGICPPQLCVCGKGRLPVAGSGPEAMPDSSQWGGEGELGRGRGSQQQHWGG